MVVTICHIWIFFIELKIYLSILIIMIKIILFLIITIFQFIYLLSGGIEKVYIASHDNFMPQHESEIKGIIGEYTDNFGLNMSIILKVPVRYFYPYFNIYYYGQKQDIFLRHSKDDKFSGCDFIIYDKSNVNHYNEIPENTVLVYNLDLSNILSGNKVAKNEDDMAYTVSEFHYPDNEKKYYNPYNRIGYANDVTFLKIYNDITRKNYTNTSQIPYNCYECEIQYHNKVQLLLMLSNIITSHDVDIYYEGKLADILVLSSIPVLFILYFIIIIRVLQQIRKRKMLKKPDAKHA